MYILKFKTNVPAEMWHDLRDTLQLEEYLTLVSLCHGNTSYYYFLFKNITTFMLCCVKHISLHI